MPKPYGLTRDRRLLRQLVSLALFVVQAIAACTSLIEGREGIGAGAHVEAQNIARHYVHDEATCAFCAVRTIHANPPAVAPTIRASVAATFVVIRLESAPHFGADFPATRPRPPPTSL